MKGELLECPECHEWYPARMYRLRANKAARLSCAGCVYRLGQIRAKQQEAREVEHATPEAAICE